jgi:hypothetical protein
MIVLNEFAIDFEALLFIENEFRILGFRVYEEGEISGEAVWKVTIGSATSFHLKHAHINPHLDYISPIVTLDQSHAERMGIERPVLEEFV